MDQVWTSASYTIPVNANLEDAERLDRRASTLRAAAVVFQEFGRQPMGVGSGDIRSPDNADDFPPCSLAPQNRRS